MEDKLNAKAPVKPLLKSQMVRDREVQLADNSHCLYAETNEVHKSSCTEVYYQCGQQSTKSDVILSLLAQIVKEPCFNVLRTQEQLGYIVASGIRRTCGVQGLIVIVQSDRHPEYLDSRIENFVASMEEKLVEMSDEEFERNKTAHIVKLNEKPKRLSQRTGRFWGEITSRQLNFDRVNVETAAVKELTKEDVIEFYRAHIKAGSPLRKKLGVHVVSMEKDGAGVVKKDEDKVDIGEVEKVEDIMDFRTARPLYPNVKPFVDINTLFRKKR